MAKRKLIGFSWLPASWGLSGDAYAVAEAHYYHEGEELDRALAIINNRTDPVALARKNIDIDVCYGKSTPYDAARQKINISPLLGVDREVALLEIECKFDKMSQSEFEKQRATLKDEPWIAIISSGFDPEQGLDGVFFEFDWNERWIEFLKLNGYVGHSDEQIVDDWFTDVCRSHNATERVPVHEDD
jgi:hypothetical protein